MSLLPQSYQLIHVFTSPLQQCEFKTCVVHTSHTHQIIACIREETTNNNTKTFLLISVHSNKANFNQNIQLDTVHIPTRSYCAIDQNGQDVIVLFEDYYYFSYTIMRNNFYEPKLRNVILPKSNKIGGVNCFTVFSHCGLPVGVFGTRNGIVGFFNVNSGMLIQTISISKKPIEEIQLSQSILLIQTGKMIYIIKIKDNDELIIENPIKFCTSDIFYVNKGQIGVNINNKLQIWNIGIKGPILLKEIDYSNRVYTKTNITACSIGDLIFISDTKCISIIYDSTVIYCEKLMEKPKGIIPFQLPTMEDIKLFEGIVIWNENQIILCKPTKSIEQIIINQLKIEEDIEKQNKIYSILRGYESSKETIIAIAKILVKEYPIKSHKLLETFNIFNYSIYQYIFIHHKLSIQEYDLILQSIEKHSEESIEIADLIVSIYIIKDYYYGITADSSFIKYLNQKVLYNRTKAMTKLVEHPKLFWRYILELLLLCELKVVKVYCKTIRSLSMNIVEPQLFISSLIKNVPKSIFEILNTSPLYDSLTIPQKFDMLCKAIKLSPNLSHIIQLESLLFQLKPQQLDCLTQLIKPKTLTFSCICMINDYAKYDLYDLYVKAVLFQQLPLISGDVDKIIDLIQSFDNLLFDFSRTYQFLELNSFILESAILLYLYGQYETALEYLFNKLETLSNKEDIEIFILKYIIGKITENELLSIINNNNYISSVLLNLLLNKNKFICYFTPTVITQLELNYIKITSSSKLLNKQKCLERIILSVDGTAQRLITTAKAPSEIIIFCPKKHKFTIRSLKQKAKITTKIDPTNNVIKEMNKLINAFLLENEFSNNKLICPLCVKSILEPNKLEKDEEK
ncbi:hypothetical protein KM1_183920 [Entamoeba histolytica HM-3:IMSS]|uniref:Uncharacterized protein n=2 Tax=Entamoeba histolytica TaxID=5759 RepID=M2RWN3_ENTHI|nr:Hypothetical protein EHI5A_076500 [Entamoeba histolytica KU27]EMS13910.1 hypothetical protein KM1_183920 [Entamoeba histolytica HM-3:IMSS]